MTKHLLWAGLAAVVLSATSAVASGKGYHCELKKDGKAVDDDTIKTRKECKKKGGKWVKEHSHDHDHDEKEEKSEKKEGGEEKKEG